MMETTLDEAFIWHRLGFDAELIDALQGQRVYEFIAPPRTPHPFVTYNFMAGHSVLGNNTVRLLTECLYLVKVIAEVDNARLLEAPRVRRAAHRLDDLLAPASQGGVSFRVDNYYSCYICMWRQGAIHYSERGVTANISYLHLGGLYRFQVMNIANIGAAA